MSTEDLPQDGLRVGGWIAPSTPTGPGGDPGTVYRGGAHTELEVWEDFADTAPPDAASRRTALIVVGLAAAAALALAGVAVMGTAPEPDRVVGTMAYPAPLLPAPPPLPPGLGASVPADAPSDRPRARGDAPAGPSPAATATSTPIVVSSVASASAPPAPPPAAPASAPPPSRAAPGEVAVALTVGTSVSLETVTRSGHLVRHDSSRAVVGRIGLGSSAEERATARFVVRAGLADRDCVSFESEDRPRRFLRHRNFAVYLHRADRTSLFARDATFCPVPVAGGHTLLRSENFPERYLGVRDSLLFLERGGGTTDSTMFTVRPPV